MKRNLIKIRFLFMTLFIIIITSCENEQGSNNGPAEISNIKHSDCKSLNSLKSVKQDCVEYQAINGNYLRIKRINVAFNCCIDGVLVLVKDTQNKEIIIHETEIISTPCDCICLYDIEYTLGPLDYGIYSFQIVEQYADTMKFEVMFTSSTNGEYCEERNSYPWDLE